MEAALAIPWGAAVLLSPFDGRKRWVGWLAPAALGATLAMLIFGRAAGDTTVVTGGRPAGAGIALDADPLSIVFATVSIGLLLVIASFEAARGFRVRAFPALVMYLAAGLMGLFLTKDVFNFYVFFEVSMAAAFVLTFSGEERRFLHAGFIFMVVNLLGSALFLIGTVALYHASGTLDMARIASSAEGRGTLMIAATLLFVALGVKLGLFPFHSWVPTVYRSSSPAVAAMLSGVLANIGAYGLIRFGGDVLSQQRETAEVFLLVLGGASIVYGALIAVSRGSVPEVLAYSSISQAGFILVALAVGGTAGITAAVLIAVANAANKTVLFLSGDLAGRLGAIGFAIGAISLAGLPPSAGFFGKVAILRAGSERVDLAVILVVTVGSALSMAYIFRAYQRHVWREPPTASGPAGMAAAPVLLAGVVLLVGLIPAPLLTFAQRAAARLSGGA